MKTHQTPEQIIASASPEQKIMWNHLYLRFGERLSISPLFFQFTSALSEFITYKAGIMYVAYKLSFGHTGAGIATPNLVTVYDETNTISGYLNPQNALFDATAAANEYAAKYVNIENIIFSRVVLQNLTSLRFIGYRLSY